MPTFTFFAIQNKNGKKQDLLVRDSECHQMQQRFYEKEAQKCNQRKRLHRYLCVILSQCSTLQRECTQFSTYFKGQENLVSKSDKLSFWNDYTVARKGHAISWSVFSASYFQTRNFVFLNWKFRVTKVEMSSSQKLEISSLWTRSFESRNSKFRVSKHENTKFRVWKFEAEKLITKCHIPYGPPCD